MPWWSAIAPIVWLTINGYARHKATAITKPSLAELEARSKEMEKGLDLDTNDVISTNERVIREIDDRLYALGISEVVLERTTEAIAQTYAVPSHDLGHRDADEALRNYRRTLTRYCEHCGAALISKRRYCLRCMRNDLGRVAVDKKMKNR